MICTNCGKENVDTAAFCESCGTKLTPAAPAAPEVSAAPEVNTATVSEATTVTAPQPQYTPPQPRPVPATPYNNYAPVAKPATPVIPPEYKPLSGWAYFGWQLLFAIPLVGFILLIVFACGGTHNINLRNFARSYFCALLIAAILAVIGIILTLVFGASVFAILQDAIPMY